VALDGWMTLEEAGRTYGIAASTLRNQVAVGKLEARKHGGVWFTTEEWMQTYKKEHPHPGRRPGQKDQRPRRSAKAPAEETHRGRA
jgi:hypothetical protein